MTLLARLGPITAALVAGLLMAAPAAANPPPPDVTIGNLPVGFLISTVNISSPLIPLETHG